MCEGIWGHIQVKGQGQIVLQIYICTSYPKVMAMIDMSKPKKASNFLRPAGEGRCLLIVDVLLSFEHFLRKQQTWKPTVLVQKEEEKCVYNGDEDASPQRDPAR